MRLLATSCEALKDLLDVSGHAEDDRVLNIVEVDGDTQVSAAKPVNLDAVKGLQTLDQMLSCFSRVILDTKIVDN